MVLYMSFDNFLLAVESRDLSQADKSIIRVSSFPKLLLNDKIYSYTKKNYLFGTWQFGKIDVSVNFIIQKFARLKSKHFLVRGKSERFESIHFAESSGLSCWETEKEVLLPITQLWERIHSYCNTFVSLR